jgi:serine/threonine protein kinase
LYAFQALGVTLLEMATGTPAPAEGDAYHGLREGRIDMPNHLSPDLRELLKMLLHTDPAWRPSAREILRHPLLCGLMRDESIACLRTQPNCPPEVQRTSATLTESDLEPELMVCVHDRALKAEKEAARLRAALQTAQQEADMWRERAKVLGNSNSHWSGVCSGKGTASPQ